MLLTNFLIDGSSHSIIRRGVEVFLGGNAGVFALTNRRYKYIKTDLSYMEVIVVVNDVKHYHQQDRGFYMEDGPVRELAEAFSNGQ